VSALSGVSAAEAGLGHGCTKKKQAGIRMNFPRPVHTDLNDLIDQAIRIYAKDIPISFENLFISLKRRAAVLEIGGAMLAERIRNRATELGVELIA
jgi:hypothetical protein